MKIRSKFLPFCAAACFCLSANAGIYDFGTYDADDFGYIPDDMLEMPDSPGAYVSGIWLTQDFLGRDIKFVVQLAEGIPYVGEVGSDPIPVNIVKVANDETVTVQLLAGEKKQIMLKEVNKDGERLLLVQPVGAKSAMQFTDSSLEYLTPNQVAQSAKDLKQ